MTNWYMPDFVDFAFQGISAQLSGRGFALEGLRFEYLDSRALGSGGFEFKGFGLKGFGFGHLGGCVSGKVSRSVQGLWFSAEGMRVLFSAARVAPERAIFGRVGRMYLVLS